MPRAVCLIPDKAFTSWITSQPWYEQSFLAAQLIPHVTICMLDDLPEQAFNVPKSLRVTSVSQGAYELRTTSLELEQNPQLAKINAQLFVRTNRIAKFPSPMPPPTEKWYKEYGKNVFHPHISLGFMPVASFPAVINFEAVALCELGMYCQPKRIIWKQLIE